MRRIRVSLPLKQQLRYQEQYQERLEVSQLCVLACERSLAEAQVGVFSAVSHMLGSLQTLTLHCYML